MKSEYRAKLRFVTSGNAVVTVLTEWVAHRDMVEEVVNSARPFKNKRQEFAGYEIQQRHTVKEEP